MDMDIDETGEHSGVMQINGSEAGQAFKILCNRNNTARLNGNVSRPEPAVLQDHCVFQDIIHNDTPFPARAAGRYKSHFGLLYRIGHPLSTPDFCFSGAFSGAGGQTPERGRRRIAGSPIPRLTRSLG